MLRVIGVVELELACGDEVAIHVEEEVAVDVERVLDEDMVDVMFPFEFVLTLSLLSQAVELRSELPLQDPASALAEEDRALPSVVLSSNLLCRAVRL